MFGNYIQQIYLQYSSNLAPTKIGLRYLNSENLKRYIGKFCSSLGLSKNAIVFKQDFSEYETITFEKCYNKEFDKFLWTGASIKYRLSVNENTVYSSSTYNSIVNNAYILININNIRTGTQEEFYKLFLLMCCLFINKHHVCHKNGFKTNITINDFLMNCMGNLIARMNADIEKFKSDVIKTSIKNTESVYNTKNKVTLGSAPSNVRHSLSNMKFSSEELDYVKSLREQGCSLRAIQKSFELKYNKKISLGKLSSLQFFS